MICEEVLCGMFGAYLIDDAVAIRKRWENWEAEIHSPSGKLDRKGTPEIRVQGRGHKAHPYDCSRGDAERAQVLAALDRAQRSLMNLLCLIFNTDLGEKHP